MVMPIKILADTYCAVMITVPYVNPPTVVMPTVVDELPFRVPLVHPPLRVMPLKMLAPVTIVPMLVIVLSVLATAPKTFVAPIPCMGIVVTFVIGM